ncbi:Polyketide synthase enoylreductase [Penicillium alfredii]|uniref:Polyketide synthase enoylreductase n=1 Tax=Penicillium alfredii TaxID=1506179 RepID=A0A9W9ENH3_9EURO|nr:Polyketide synthase enoylreductase [Penicillium alfredii]KAJ5084955.1 Polyketide synthase enoylreductase [Penicillium alfredii]
MSVSTCLQSGELQKHTTFYREFHESSIGSSGVADVKEPPVVRQLLHTRQRALLLNKVREPYTLVHDHTIPAISHHGEILVKVLAIGLNPIDWKGPAFNFGIPSLPWINGRDLVGVVLQIPKDSARLRVGDIVLVPSTDYRDIRKAAFQEYAVATASNAARVPSSTSICASASLGVAFVASALALGVSFGLDFSLITQSPGPNLALVIKGLQRNEVPTDIQEECFAPVLASERPQRGDWIAIWGASTTTGQITSQLAKLSGLRVICVADIARHGDRLLQLGADLLVDRQDPHRAIEVIRGITRGKLRYAIDLVGSDTATLLQRGLETTGHAHLLGLTGLPKSRDPNIRYHTVPIKLFHTAPAVGESIVCWLESLLQSRTLTLPEVVRAEGGLEGINGALDKLRNGNVSGKRVVVDLRSPQ